MTCLQDYEKEAQRHLPPGIWAYLNAGGAQGLTQRWNRAAFERLALLPRVLRRPGANAGTAVTLFGHRYSHPIFIAPMAYHRLAHPDGEHATGLAASALQAGLVVSTQSSITLEDIAQRAQGPLWFQLYLQPRREITLALLRRAEQAGYGALVLTVDAPIQGLRNEDQRQGFRLPPDVQPVNLAPYAALNSPLLPAGASLFQHPLIQAMPDWEDIAWLIRQTRLPVLLKGILHPLDVQPALDAGAAGIIVSNHGGRVLDTVPAMLDALPAIVQAVAGRVPVLADGGLRRGTDVFKTLALGADAVLLGRPILHGLTVAGAPGVAHVLNLLRAELEATMVLTGCATLADIDATRLRANEAMLKHPQCS